MSAAGRNYLDPVVLQKIKHLDVRARLVVEGFITGLHQSPYHGFAVEFATHREYVPGDEIKHIDWKVWSKTDRYFIKEYEEETNLRCTMIVDASRSMRYGGADGKSMSKFDYASTLAACLGLLLQRQQDAVGLVTFDTDVRTVLSPATHPNHIKLLTHQLESTEPDHHTDVAHVFPKLIDAVGGRGLVVLVSDLFVDVETLKKALHQFRHRRHDMVVFHVLHDDELRFPFTDNTKFRGLEVDLELLTEPRALRQAYLAELEAYLAQVRRICATSGIDYVQLNTAQPLDAALHGYLAFRQRSLRSAVRR